MHDSIQKLRLDRRLLGRRGWVSEQELERELASLPDVADKAVPLGSDADDAGPAGAESSD